MSPKFEDYIDALAKEQNSKNVLKILYNIRKDVDWPKNKANVDQIREKGTLKYLVNHLQSPHKHIIDVCLSILGNIVMDPNCAREALGMYNILQALIKVLKRYANEDSISGRSFRILGNICQHTEDWASRIIDKGEEVIIHLVEVLKVSAKEDEEIDKIKYSEATILMALRALRHLTNQYTIKFLTTKFPVLAALGGLFIKTSLEWQKNKTYNNVLEAIINLFQSFSKYKDYNIINELKNTDRGNALEELASVLLLNPKKVMKIIMNLIGISKFKSDLPVPDICNKFVEQVFKKYIDAESEEFKIESLEYIHCLCYLLDHPANRNGHQCGKTIPLLVQVLEKLDTPTEAQLQCCVLLINTLNKCQYEESLLQEQLRCNILDVVLKKLQWLVNDSDIYAKHRFKKGQKRKSSALKRRLQFGGGEVETQEGYGKRKMCSCGDCVDGNCLMLLSFPASPSFPQSPTTSEENYRQRQLSPVSSDDEVNYFSSFKIDRSPSPCSSSSSEYTGLTWASPCSSPRSLNNDASSYSDSDDYSPVCSEADSTEFPVTVHLDESSMDVDKHSEITENEEKLPFERTFENNTTNNLKIRLITEIAKLIKSYTKIQPPVSQLASEDLLLSLLNCSQFFNTKQSTYITTVNVVCDILHSPCYLLPLMKTSFVEKIYRLTEFVHTTHCVVCVDHSCTGKMVLRRLTSLAECAAGKGDIAHELLRGTSDVKRQLVLVIPYIVENKSILSKLLLNCGGLNILMKLLKEDSVHKQRTIKVLCALASKKLEIANPKKVAMDVDEVATAAYINQSEVSVNMVTFKLDDGKCIRANRDFLTEKSDYFSSLLNGHFKESSEDEVCLHNVKFQTLHCLLRLVKCVNMLDKVDIDTLLDVIALSDRYLMHDICCFVTNYVEKYKISAKTVPIIYRWSLESGLNLLRVEAIAFALVANIVDNSRFVMFSDLFQLGYSEELVDDIQKLLVRYLSSFSN